MIIHLSYMNTMAVFSAQHEENEILSLYLTHLPNGSSGQYLAQGYLRGAANSPGMRTHDLLIPNH